MICPYLDRFNRISAPSFIPHNQCKSKKLLGWESKPVSYNMLIKKCELILQEVKAQNQNSQAKTLEVPSLLTVYSNEEFGKRLIL